MMKRTLTQTQAPTHASRPAGVEPMEPRILMSTVSGDGVFEFNGDVSRSGADRLVIEAAPYYVAMNGVRHANNGQDYQRVADPGFSDAQAKALINATFEWKIDGDKGGNVDFESGSSYQGFSIGHRFAEAGEYRVELRVTEADGASSVVYHDTLVIDGNGATWEPDEPVYRTWDQTDLYVSSWQQLNNAIDQANANAGQSRPTRITLAPGAGVTRQAGQSELPEIQADNLVIRGSQGSNGQYSSVTVPQSIFASSGNAAADIFRVNGAENVVFTDLRIVGRGLDTVDHDGNPNSSKRQGFTHGIHVLESEGVLIDNVHFSNISQKAILSRDAKNVGVFDSEFVDLSRYVWFAGQGSSDSAGISGGYTFHGNSVINLSGSEHSLRFQGYNRNDGNTDDGIRGDTLLQHSVVSNNVFQSQSVGMPPKTAVQIRGNNEFSVVRNNVMDQSLSIKPQNEQSDSLARYALIENNLIYFDPSRITTNTDSAQLPGGSAMDIRADYVTVRNNVIDNFNRAFDIKSRPVLGTPTGIYLLHNTSVTRDRTALIDRADRGNWSPNPYGPYSNQHFFIAPTGFSDAAFRNQIDVHHNLVVRVQDSGKYNNNVSLVSVFSDSVGGSDNQVIDAGWTGSQVLPSGGLPEWSREYARTDVDSDAGWVEGVRRSLMTDYTPRSGGDAAVRSFSWGGAGIETGVLWDALNQRRTPGALEDGAVATTTIASPDPDPDPDPPALLPGDFNGNRIVEQGDLDLMLAYWGDDISGGSRPDGWVNVRGVEGLVDQSELDLLLRSWGESS